MKCQSCQFENPDGMKFCGQCGRELLPPCPHCSFINPPEFSFCGRCGGRLDARRETRMVPSSQVDSIPFVEKEPDEDTPYEADSERKYVTVMFSDLTGYTRMSEKLDPEDVKEITGAIFSEIAKIIEKYDGFIEKYVGDAVLAVFGAVEAFEDGALRAIKAAREIHAHVESGSPRYEKLIGHPLSMHTGIKSGLVVTGEIEFQKGTHGMVGDTINTAARLMSASQAGEIIVDHDAMLSTEGYFEYTRLDPLTLKGKTKPIQAYRVEKPLQAPNKLHRLQGIRAELIGRSVEMQVLEDAAERLENGFGSIIAVSGTAGSGKSRLIHDFKNSYDLSNIQWFDASAYPYTQNTPYYPLIDLLTKAFAISDDDSTHTIKRKVESNLENLLGKDSEKIPFIGGLFAAEYEEISDVSPEYWKEQLYAAVEQILSALASAKPTVICIDDMHWADAPFTELARKLMAKLSGPILLIFIYRPIITLLTQFETESLNVYYKELRLKELSPSETQSMVSSLLKSENIPKELRRFIHDNVDGNPFYVEELINSLIESESLSNTAGNWEIVKPIEQTGITTNLQGVIAGRIDRLEKKAKRILQEASVIGRAFLFDILQRISRIKEDLDKNLVALERLDLINARSLHPSLEYIFKHALTQEIVYSGLVKSERQSIHEKIGFVIEQLFPDRLSEFYEILAFHFSEGGNFHKAIDYLIRSGEKCLKRYAVQDSDRYYRKAYDLILGKYDDTSESRDLLFGILTKWSLICYYRGDFKEHSEILKRHEAEADLLDNQELKGMYYGWLGFILHFRSDLQESYQYLQKALKVGESANNQKVIGYACTWLTWLCAIWDRYDEGYRYWQRAVAIAQEINADAYLYQKAMGGLCQLTPFTGEKGESQRIGTELIQFGKERSNIRSQVVGHMCIGHACYADGNLVEAASSYKTAMEAARDPFYTQWPKLYFGMCCVLTGQMEEGAQALNAVSSYIEQYGCEIFNGAALVFQGLLLLNQGEMGRGFDLIQKVIHHCRTIDFKWGIALSQLLLGNLYYQLAHGEKKGDLSALRNNLGFLAKHLPFASKKSESHFVEAIECAQQCGARGLLGQAHLGLGQLYKARKRDSQAADELSEAANIFKELNSQVHFDTAAKALEACRQGVVD